MSRTTLTSPDALRINYPNGGIQNKHKILSRGSIGAIQSIGKFTNNKNLLVLKFLGAFDTIRSL
jgi:hypothetical protein